MKKDTFWANNQLKITVFGKRQLCIYFILFLFSTTGLYPQNWQKEETKNRWGDITGYSYMQTALGTVKQNKDIPIAIVYTASADYKTQNMFAITSRTISALEFHPAAGFIDEAVTLSLRKDGITKTYRGSTFAEMGNYNEVWIGFVDADLINTLKQPGQWDVLIEGRRWYIKTTIKGSLPSN